MFKKIAIFTVFLFTVFLASPASAVDNTSNIPETNPFCWHLKDCQKQRKLFGGSGTGEEGFVSDASVAPCVGGVGEEKWGRCLPAGTSKTEISFGGKSEFSNVGDFIVLMYKYMLTIASIVAAVMIIIAGMQWITSAGNSDAINSAKKRIAGALIGLFIGYMSYFILNTINPALVNLRLPQVWLVRPQSLTPEFCSELDPKDEGKIKFMFAAPLENQGPITLETAAGKADGFKWTKPASTLNFYCGNRFFVESGGKTPCRGDYCPPVGGNQKSCFTLDEKSYSCGDVRMTGKISYTSPFKNCGFFSGAISNQAGDLGGPWDCPPTGKIQLLMICKDMSKFWAAVDDGDVVGVADKTDFMKGFSFGDDGKGTSQEGRYSVSESSQAVKGLLPLCGDEKSPVSDRNWGGVKGFAVDFLMIKNSWVVSNKSHLVGKGGVDLGWWEKIADELYKVDSRYLFSVEEILEGGRLNIDVAEISDETSITEKNKSYWESGYGGKEGYK
jgi:hypothetical protein